MAVEVTVLGCENYNISNAGDCIIIKDNRTVIIYDCGCEEHAIRVKDYMLKHEIKSAIFILSHNDRDHFAGLDYLIDNRLVNTVITNLLLKHKEELYKCIGDRRITNNSLSNRILGTYDNIARLGNRGIKLIDPYSDEKHNLSNGYQYEVTENVKIIGPYYKFMIETASKAIREQSTSVQTANSDETVVNATSLQVEINLGWNKMLLCGDAPYSILPKKLENYTYIQLPHHGKLDHAEDIICYIHGEALRCAYINHVYIISDNTGATNGGSDKFYESLVYTTLGKDLDIRNTKKQGDIIIRSWR